MSLRKAVRAFPALLRVGVAEAIAYRAEMLVWVLATTMPLVMLALWTSVARTAPVGRYGEAEFVTYFLCTFIVRQVTGSWIFWQMNVEVRDGTLAMRLLRPIHPLWAYTAEGLASAPMRALVSVPAAAVALAATGGGLTRDPARWALWGVAVLGAWLLTLLFNFLIGCASFFLESSTKLMDAWLVFYFVLSGYIVPVDLFPRSLGRAVDWLPFRYQLALPVELMTGARGLREGAALVLGQWAWIVVAGALTALLWRRGVRRFEAFGG
ncbi:MAG: ABC-2 family transporter protein [Myxococcales bacterium]|nr:ABC-2 family transporter protein [Myxococcales bacterium]